MSNLFNAIYTGNLHELIQQTQTNFDPNMIMPNNSSILFNATYHGHLPIVQHLVESGANIEHRECNRKTPLYCASEMGHLDIVKYLLSCGANSNIKIIDIMTRGLHGNPIQHYRNIMRLRQQPNIEYGSSPLQAAVSREHFDIVKCLVEYGADVNNQDYWKQTALHRAVYHKNTMIIEYLIEHSINTQICDRNNKTAVEIAYDEGLVDIAHIIANPEVPVKGVHLD